jgi:hypothetical protein
MTSDPGRKDRKTARDYPQPAEGAPKTTGLTLEHLEGGRWRVTIRRGDTTGTLDLDQAECDQLWVMLGDSRGEGTFSRTVTFHLTTEP